MKCSYKMAVPTALLVFLTSLIVTMIVYRYTVVSLEEEATEDLTAYASVFMDKIERVFYNKYIDVKYLARDPAIKSTNSSPKQIQAKLEEFVEIHRAYESASFFNAKRVRIADTAKKKIGEVHVEQGYWKQLKEKDFVQDVSISESLGKPVAHFAHVVRSSSGAIIGYVVLRFDVQKVIEIQKPFVLKRGIEWFEVDFLSKDGVVFFSNYEKFGSASPDWTLVKNDIASGKKLGLIKNNENGKDRIYIYAVEQGVFDYAGSGNMLIFDFAKDDVLAPAIRLRNIIIAIFTVSNLIAVLFIYKFTGFITKPLNRLSSAAMELGKGNLMAAEIVDYAGRDEIGTLTGTFKHMAKSIKNQRDIIDKYNAELEESRNELLNAQRVGLFGNIKWDVVNDRISCSEEVYELIGATKPEDRDKIGYDLESYLKLVHPADLQAVKRAIRGALNGDSGFSIDFRIFRLDKEEKYFFVRGEVEYDEAGRPMCLIGTIQDITDRKRIEEALRASEERYRLLADNVKDAIYRYEFKSVKGFKYISRAIEHITGYKQEDFYKNPELFFDLIHEDDRAALQLYIAGPAMIDRPYAVRFVRKDGVLVWIEMRNVQVFDSMGGLVAIEGVARDITERVEAEQTMKMMNTELLSALENVKKLSGMLPICASCKNIRSDTGYWNTIEQYITEHSEAVFSHSICPECMKKLYPEFADEVLKKDEE